MILTHFLVFNSFFTIGILLTNIYLYKKIQNINPKYLSELEFHNGVKFFHTKEKLNECQFIYKVNAFDMDHISRILNIRGVVNTKIKIKKNQIYHTINDRSDKDFDQIYGIIIRDCFNNLIEISKNNSSDDNVYLFIEI